MDIPSGIILFVVLWILSLLTVLPLRIQTQDEAGEVEPGTPRSSPQTHHLKRKLRIATLLAAVIWVICTAVILSGVITIQDLDIFHRLDTPAG